MTKLTQHFLCKKLRITFLINIFQKLTLWISLSLIIYISIVINTTTITQTIAVWYFHKPNSVNGVAPCCKAINESSGKTSIVLLLPSSSSSVKHQPCWSENESCLVGWLSSCTLKTVHMNHWSLSLSQIHILFDALKLFFSGENNIAWKVDETWTAATSINRSNDPSSLSNAVLIDLKSFSTFAVFFNFVSRN